MLGAVIGDIIGSRFEWDNYKGKDFELFTDKCRPTDDSVMSFAVAKALVESEANYSNLSEKAVKCMRQLGSKYPNAGYGGRFCQWLSSDTMGPYNSLGNGAAMRISPVGLVARSIDEVKSLSRIVTEVTHNHPEGIKGAEAVAVAIHMANTGRNKSDIKEYINNHYYIIDFTLDNIRDEYEFDVTCQGSVPQALEAFFESTDYEDAIRNAISIGGDSDTIAAISGGIAGAFYGIAEDIRAQALTFIDDELIGIWHDFDNKYLNDR